MDNRYWVGALRFTGHPLSTFLLAEFVSEEEDGYLVRNVLRAIESPNEDGRVGLNFMTDGFFTEDVPVKVEKSSLVMSRMLDPEKDHRAISQINKFISNLRMSRAGLVGGVIASPGER